MTEERDPKVSRRYRELGAEEPPRELDQAILAAAHRAADRSHAPLVAPAGRHRWYFAFGAAAILVLAVAVTVQVERQPDPETLTAAVAPPVSERKESFSDTTPQPKEEARPNLQKQPVPSKPPSSPARDAGSSVRERPQAAEVARADRLEAPRQRTPAETHDRPAAPAAPVPPQADSQDQSSGAAAGMFSIQEQARKSREAAPAAAAPPPEVAARPQAKAQSGVVASMASPLGPEQFLERIAELRKEGRQGEADKALAEFRQRYPDYRIPEEMLKKVERPK